jgi:lipopolysaccharide export system permease protein
MEALSRGTELDLLKRITSENTGEPDDGSSPPDRRPTSGRKRGFGPFRLLTRYTLWEVAVPTGLALAVVGFLAVAVELREQFREMPVENLTGMDVARLLMYFLPSLVVFVIPITYMMGILLAFGRLSQNNEITAMKAAGIPLKRLVVPVIMCGALLSAGCFYLQDWVQPIALRRANQLMFVELPLRATLDVLATGRMHEFGGWRVYIRDRDPATRTLKDVEILVPQSDGSVLAYWAESARLIREDNTPKILMSHGHLILPLEGGGATRVVLENAKLSVPSLSARRIRSARRSLPLRALLEEETRLTEEYEKGRTSRSKDELRKMRWEVGERIAFPLSCLAVSLLAAPLAVRGHRGGRSYSFAIGFTIIFVYQFTRLVLEPDSLHSLTEAIVRASMPNVLLLVAGVWALWRVDRV